MGLWIALLGPFRVSGEGACAPEGDEARGLLAMLALSAGRPVSEERLVGGLFGAQPRAWARRTLQVYATRAQQALGPQGSRLERRLGALSLDAGPGEVDVAWFDDLVAEGTEEALAHALTLWRGVALSGLHHFPFAQLEARRLEHRRSLVRGELSALRA